MYYIVEFVWFTGDDGQREDPALAGRLRARRRLSWDKP